MDVQVVELQVHLAESEFACMYWILVGPTCHFKHAGLKEGSPLRAASKFVKTWRVATSLRLGDRRGRSLAG